MEIRARYILMGGFLLAVIISIFGFIFWLENAGGFRDRTSYRITFDGPVSGLYSGSSVLFNGIRVGEVTALRFAADRPSEVLAEVAIDASAPIRQDTIIDLEYQGLTGVASISLTGGKSDAPLIDDGDGIPVLKAREGAGQTVTQSARDALLKLHTILDDNTRPIKELVGNLKEFTGALSRNSGKVDGILAGLERMTGGTRGPDTEKVFELLASADPEAKPANLRGQLMVPLPTAIFQLDTQNILFRKNREAAPLPPGARWADNLTRLVQAKVTQSFENSGYIGSVSHSDAVVAEYQLVLDIRRFQLLTEPEPKAEIAFSAKIVDTNGAILGAELFEASAEAASSESGPAVDALNGAFGKAASNLVAWAGKMLAVEETKDKADLNGATTGEPVADTAPEAVSQADEAPVTAEQPKEVTQAVDAVASDGEAASPAVEKVEDKGEVTNAVQPAEEAGAAATVSDQVAETVSAEDQGAENGGGAASAVPSAPEEMAGQARIETTGAVPETAPVLPVESLSQEAENIANSGPVNPQ